MPLNLRRKVIININDKSVEIIPIPNKRIKDLTGQKFERLIVKGYIGKNNKNHALWLCRCSCDNYTLVTTTDLKSGHVKSCGCLKIEMTIERNKNNSYAKHGQSRTRIYRIWQLMKDRCSNVNRDRYKDYGGRGITYCKEWVDFKCFYSWAIDNGYKENLTIDRINVNGNYEPNNCRWITNKEQQNNKRYHHLFLFNGEIKNLAQWGEETGLPYDIIWRRIQDGFDSSEVLSPIKDKYKINDVNEVKNILDLYHNRKYSARKIARLYNTGHQTILRIIRRNVYDE